MTDKVFYSPDRDMTTKILGQLLQYAGGSDPGWVVPSGTAKIADAARNGFGESSSGASLDVTIDTGEAFVQGCWVDRDTTTTVTLAASTADQTVYVGLDLSMKNKVIIGLSADFSANDPKMAIWTYDTDGSGVTSTTDERHTSPGRGLDVPEADNADTLDNKSAGNSNGDIPVSNGTVNTNLNADKVDGKDASNASGDVPVSNGTVNANLNAEKVNGISVEEVYDDIVTVSAVSTATLDLISQGCSYEDIVIFSVAQGGDEVIRSYADGSGISYAYIKSDGNGLGTPTFELVIYNSTGTERNYAVEIYKLTN